jgi:dephospho-CoA kinase
MIVITAPFEQRIRRAVRRDKLTREQVLQRINAQMPLEEKASQADFVIDNAGTVDALHQKIDVLWGKIAVKR